MIVLLWISLVVNIIFGLFKAGVENSYSEDPYHPANFVIITCLNIANAWIVSFFNIFLKIAARYLTEKEQHDTYTENKLSVTIKMVVAMYVNSAIIPLGINFSHSEWFVSSGLLSDVFYHTLSIWFFGPLLYLYDIGYVIKMVTRYIESKRGEKSDYTQRELNELYEGQKISLENRYTNCLLIILIWCTYTVLLPVLPMICFFGILYQYLMIKYMLVRHHQRPRKLNELLDMNTLRFFPPLIVVYQLSILFFVSRLSSTGVNWWVWIQLAITGIFLLAPMTLIEDKLSCHIVKRSDEDTYEAHWTNFQFDYENCNPVNYTRKDILFSAAEPELSKSQDDNAIRRMDWIVSELYPILSYICDKFISLLSANILPK